MKNSRKIKTYCVDFGLALYPSTLCFCHVVAMAFENKICPRAKVSATEVNRHLMQMSCYCVHKSAPFHSASIIAVIESADVFLYLQDKIHDIW